MISIKYQVEKCYNLKIWSGRKNFAFSQSSNFIKKKGSNTIKENIDNREGQTDSTPVHKYILLGVQKAFDVITHFRYGAPLYMNIEGRGFYYKRLL